MTKKSFFPLPKNDPADKDWKVPFSEALKPNTRFQQLIHLLFVMNGGHYAMNNSSQDDLLHVVWQDFKNASRILLNTKHEPRIVKFNKWKHSWRLFVP